MNDEKQQYIDLLIKQAKDSVYDQGIFSDDQIIALHDMINFLKKAMEAISA